MGRKTLIQTKQKTIADTFTETFSKGLLNSHQPVYFFVLFIIIIIIIFYFIYFLFNFILFNYFFARATESL